LYPTKYPEAVDEPMTAILVVPVGFGPHDSLVRYPHSLYWFTTQGPSADFTREVQFGRYLKPIVASVILQGSPFSLAGKKYLAVSSEPTRRKAIVRMLSSGRMTRSRRGRRPVDGEAIVVPMGCPSRVLLPGGIPISPACVAFIAYTFD
jgi:hypothetical protein